ncbi:DUF3188 domain-containing protein [Vagococcus sp. BWB3-3]|uniref:DUF3188 domain-containing protein n=1 Tax=Vagococcus allomyrinae TaxID=2794353 RepID=A0A940PFC0_9ENTE|nr:DUF3188 domain-containing protein [Vagococcus allomyrinae]MBP1043810.1 DUF3188 domain-containing protein [Vagococcus allomyrinae]
MMAKNGLFLISIGLILIMLSANANTGVYDGLSLVTAAFLIIVGIALMLWHKRRAKLNNLNKQNRTLS